jgi:hypothetical protein
MSNCSNMPVLMNQLSCVAVLQASQPEGKLSPSDKVSMLVGAAMHDAEHPGEHCHWQLAAAQALNTGKHGRLAPENQVGCVRF